MTTTELKPGDPVRVVNRDHGHTVFPSAKYNAVYKGTAVDGDVWVRVSPSIRPGMPYDRISYPADWIEKIMDADAQEPVR